MRRRLADWELPKVDPSVLGAGQGASAVPYDRSAEEVPQMTPMNPDEELPPEAMQGAEAGAQQALPVPGGGMEAPPAGGPGDILGGLASGGPGQMDSSALSDEDLAGMVQQQADPEMGTAEELMAALESPETPPEVKQMIQMQLATAARRRMAGIMGGGA